METFAKLLLLTVAYEHMVMLLKTLNVGPLFMAALRSKMQTLYFHPVVSSSLFISSPNLSGRRLDVYHTSTHGVA